MISERQRFIFSIRTRMVDEGVFAIPEPAFSIQARPLDLLRFKSEFGEKLKFAVRVFTRYCIVRNVNHSPGPEADEERKRAEELLQIVKQAIEGDIALFLRKPVSGLFDRKETIAEVVRQLMGDAEDGSDQSPEFLGWLGATVDAVLAEDAARMKFSLPETWPMRPNGGPERGIDRGSCLNPPL